MEEILIPLAAFAMVVAIVGFTQTAKTICYYLDWRTRMAERGLGGRSDSLPSVIQELRAEIAALKQRESEAILTFDSTLQSLDARLRHVERGALTEGASVQAASASRTVEERDEAHGSRLTAHGSDNDGPALTVSREL